MNLRLFQRDRLLVTSVCIFMSIGALFLAQIPNDTTSDWFRSLIRPEVLPRVLEKKIGLIWTTIFLLAGLGTAAALASPQSSRWKNGQVGLILGALTLNMVYTFCFTHLHNLWLSTVIAALLALLLSVLVAFTIQGRVWLSTVCHLPHLCWVCFATYVTARMASLN